ncbi:unnamed protein product [Urochloa humidicola]
MVGVIRVHTCIGGVWRWWAAQPSFALSSSSARSLRLFMASPADNEEDAAEEPEPRRALSQDIIRKYLTKISRRLRSVRPRAAAAGEGAPPPPLEPVGVGGSGAGGDRAVPAR